MCKNLLADSASLLRILSKSTLRPVLRKILTIFLSAWIAWALSSLFGFCTGTPCRIDTKFESSSLVIHWFWLSHVFNFSSPSKFNLRVLKWDSFPVWIYALGGRKKLYWLVNNNNTTKNTSHTMWRARLSFMSCKLWHLHENHKHFETNKISDRKKKTVTSKNNKSQKTIPNLPSPKKSQFDHFTFGTFRLCIKVTVQTLQFYDF